MSLFLKRRTLRRLILPIILCLSFRAAAEILVVTGTNTPLTSLSRSQVGDLFLGKVVSLPDVRNPIPIDQPDSSPIREEFYMDVANKTAAQARAHWAKLYFTGRGTPPRRARDDAEVKKMVTSMPGAIGYIDSASLDHTVKVLLVLP